MQKIPAVYKKLKLNFLKYAHIQRKITTIESRNVNAPEIKKLNAQLKKIIVNLQEFDFSDCDSMTKRFFLEYIELAQKSAFFRYAFLQVAILETSSKSKKSKLFRLCIQRVEALQKDIGLFSVYRNQLLRKINNSSQK